MWWKAVCALGPERHHTFAVPVQRTPDRAPAASRGPMYVGAGLRPAPTPLARCPAHGGSPRRRSQPHAASFLGAAEPLAHCAPRAALMALKEPSWHARPCPRSRAAALMYVGAGLRPAPTPLARCPAQRGIAPPPLAAPCPASDPPGTSAGCFACRLRVELRGIQPGIQPAARQQVRMLSLLHHPPAVHHQDPVGSHDGRQAVSNDQ